MAAGGGCGTGKRPGGETPLPGPDACARCGSCSVVCPVYGVTGRESLTARGKLHLLTTALAEKPSSAYRDIFARCLLCGACEEKCPRRLPLTTMFHHARARFPFLGGKHPLGKYLVRRLLQHRNLLAGLVRTGVNLKRLELLPKSSGLRLKLGLLEDVAAVAGAKYMPQLPEGRMSRSDAAGGGVFYFTGCLARYLQPSIFRDICSLVTSAKTSIIEAPGSQQCCGLAAYAAGDRVTARRLAKANINAFAGTQGPIITSCASCFSQLCSYPELLAGEERWHEPARSFSRRVVEISSWLPVGIGEVAAKNPLRVFYHDPCHLRFRHRLTTPPRQLLDGIGGVIRLELADGPQCCGQGGLFHLGYPRLSTEIFSDLFHRVADLEPDLVVTTCSGCLMQWRMETQRRRSPMGVMHLGSLLAGRAIPVGATHSSAAAAG